MLFHIFYLMWFFSSLFSACMCICVHMESRGKSWQLCLRYHLPYFWRQALLVAWSSPSSLHWLTGELRDLLVWIFSTGPPYLPVVLLLLFFWLETELPFPYSDGKHFSYSCVFPDPASVYLRTLKREIDSSWFVSAHDQILYYFV